MARLEPGMTSERLLAMGCSETLLQRLINEVTVRETFFFRHPDELEAIDWHRSLEGANRRGSDVVRVWVAGCASGEEAYSLAILACEAFACPAPPIEIFATDIATAALEQAQRGRYGPRAVAALTENVRRRYFTVEDGLLRVDERLRRLVAFRRHNLIRDLAPGGVPGGFDVISCRNVLIYFDPPTVARVMRSLESALAPTGTLVLGAADRLSGRSAQGPCVGSGERSVRRPGPTPRVSSPEAEWCLRAAGATPGRRTGASRAKPAHGARCRRSRTARPGPGDHRRDARAEPA